jgi:dihydroneopterin aldolase
MTDAAMTDANNDTITLTGLRVFGYHGVFEHERREGQEFIIDVQLRLDLAGPAASDDVRDTIHYGILAEQIAEAVERDPVNLIEKLAARIMDVALAGELVREATVTVHKPNAPIERAFDDVSVTLTRANPGGQRA